MNRFFFFTEKKEDDRVSRAKNPKYKSMSLEELKANMEKSRQELEAAIRQFNQMFLDVKIVLSHRLETEMT